LLIDVHIPKMGMSTVEVDILEVHAKVGQQVAVGDVLFEIEGEKAAHEVEAPIAGVVSEVLVAEGDVRSVGDIAVRLEPSRVAGNPA
jgi:pyruvate dehydrogenase E2 component (dihydrolipoamide acetyltransferase)